MYSSAFVGLCLVVCLGLSQGCARSEPTHQTDAGSSASDEKLPFHPPTDQAPASDGVPPYAAPDPKLAGALPFRGSHPRIVPAGTLLTVQLEDALSTAKFRAGDAFMASVAAPLTVDGDTLVERGAAVTGRVESARSQDGLGLVPGSGYFRLSLSAITLSGRQLALQTSSLFARGTLQQSDGVRVPKGRHLTFRLTAPVTLDDPNLANGQYSSPHSE